MPLDVSSQAKSLTTTLHYLKRGAEKPVYYRTDPPSGEERWNGIDDPREVQVVDARGRESEFTLDRNGFALVKAPTSVADFYDPEEIKRTYYPEVERLLRQTLGASRVFVFDHNVRNATRPDLAPPSRQVHNDHTVNSAPRRVRDHLGAEAPELLKHRFGVVNVWRPIRGPVLDLAACAVRRADLHGQRPDRQRPRLCACSRRNFESGVQCGASLVLLLGDADRRGAADPGA